MHKAEDILIAITVAHATAYACFIATGRTRQVKRRHALILIPGIDHALGMSIGAFDLKLIEHTLPVALQFLETFLNGRGIGKPLKQLIGFSFIELTLGIKLLCSGLVDIG